MPSPTEINCQLMWSNGFYQFSFRESPRCEAILHFLGIPGKRHHWQLEFGWGNDSPRSEMCATHAKWQVGRLFRKLPGGRQSSGHKNIFVQIICALNYAEYFDTYLHTLRATDKPTNCKVNVHLPRISKSWPRQKPGTPHNYAAIMGAVC